MNISSIRSFNALLTSGRPVIFDGGMGTMIQAAGLTGFRCPEELNITHPEVIAAIHAAYVDAGAQVVESNTFGANPHKLAGLARESRLEEYIRAAVALARRAAGDRALVAGSVGPLGDFLEPIGKIPAAQALADFRRVTGLLRDAGADLLIIETMADLKEVRAAALAARETGLPFIISMTFEESGRTVLGTPPEALAAVADALGATAVGVNCSFGPRELVPVVARLAAATRLPLIVQPNAGLPLLVEGRTVFPTQAPEFAADTAAFLDLGVTVIGGCCGTTPDHIRALAALATARAIASRPTPSGCRLASRTSWAVIGPGLPVAVIGERVNPTGRKSLAAELARGELATVRSELVDQIQAGAHVLDLNAGAAGLDEAATLPRIVELAQRSVMAPLCIDTVHPAALEACLRIVEGRPLINSVNASEKSLETVLPLAARYGAAVIALTMDEAGIPPDAAARLRLAEKIVRRAAQHGLAPEDILVDCLALAVGSSQAEVMDTLRAIQGLRSSLGTGAVLGVSNVSFGLPAREEINAAFLAMAIYAGLDAAIVNPYSTRLMTSLAAAQVIAGRDPGAAAYIARFSGIAANAMPPAAKASSDPRERIAAAVLDGDAERLAGLITSLLADGADPLSLNEEMLIPAMEKVGELFEKKILFLPQVMAAADAVRVAFAVIRERLPKSAEGSAVRVLLATVEGDIHDLGKNIFKSILENYGFEIVDLGVNVPPGEIVERVARGDIRLAGLSALMTTTLPAMEETVRLIKERVPGVPVLVGGAVLTADYAARIGADGYAPDAPQGVKLVRGILGP